MAWLKIYEWERQNFSKFYDIKVCRVEQEKIIKKLSRHFLIPIARRSYDYYSEKEGFQVKPKREIVKKFYKRYTPRIVQSRRKGEAGTYFSSNLTIKLGKTTSLSTIIHEFTHHLTMMKYNECKHNKRFKKELKRVYAYVDKKMNLKEGGKMNMNKEKGNSGDEEQKEAPKDTLHEYQLHFISTGLYTVKDFVRESEKFGVNRAFPMWFLKKRTWGDLILLGTYSPKKKPESSEKIGSASIFGYFPITRININGATEEFQKELRESLKVISVDDVHVDVERMCGEYTITSTVYIKDSLRDIVTTAEKLSKEKGIKIKLFASGSFFPLEKKVVSPVKFARNVLNIRLDTKITKEKYKDKVMGFIGDYKQRAYFKKGEKESFIKGGKVK